MKQYLTALLLISGLAAGSAWAEKADSAKPTNVESDQMAYDDVHQVNTFSGNVVLTRGTLLMKAAKVVVTQDPAGYQFASLFAGPGGSANFRQKRDGGPNQWVEGQAERIEYDGHAEVVKMFGKAKMRRLEGDRLTDEIEGEFISYDSHAEFVSVNNTPAGDTKAGGGRVKAVIQPRIDRKDK